MNGKLYNYYNLNNNKNIFIPIIVYVLGANPWTVLKHFSQDKFC